MFGFIGRRVKKTAGTFSKWAGVPGLKQLFDFIQYLSHKIFKPEQMPDETYSEAIKRLKLTPADLEERKKMFKIQMLIYALGALAVGSYTVYLIMQGYWISVTASLLIAVFLAVSALKNHFWLFQMQQQKLGCTLQEWFHASIKELK